jgi:SsrA-binding protein
MKDFGRNKKAYFNYNILEKFEAGISLIGLEVKSIKSGRINLSGAYVVVKNGEVFLVGANIPPYQPKNTPKDYNPERTRKLLLKKAEIKYLTGKIKQKGLTIVPLRVYNIRGIIKLEFAVAKGKKSFDKRESIKKREYEIEMKRKLKEFNK